MKNFIRRFAQRAFFLRRKRHDKDELSPSLLEWLEHLELEGPSEGYGREHGRAHIRCNRLGWSRLHRGRDGFLVFGKKLTPLYELTDAGRRALKAHRARVKTTQAAQTSDTLR